MISAMNCTQYTALIGEIGAFAGVFGTVAATVAVFVSVGQVSRDAKRERRQAESRARAAQLMMAAVYVSSVSDVRDLEGALRSGMAAVATMEKAQRIRGDLQLAIIFHALLTIDVTALTDDAQKPVGDAQRAMVALGNVVKALAAGGLAHSTEKRLETADRLKSEREALKRAYEAMRGQVPFEMPD